MAIEAELGCGGAGGIRTHVKLSPKHAFQACAFNHSATAPSPQGLNRSSGLDPARWLARPERRGIYRPSGQEQRLV